MRTVSKFWPPIRIAAVIPCFKVKRHILDVLSRIDGTVDHIYVVDDKCPEGTGNFVRQHVRDARVRVLFNDVNWGVGGATIEGYRQALLDGADIIVKLDGDGQMDPSLIPVMVRPIVSGSVDYTKGNRFYSLESLEHMPALRKFGNAGLSFVSKVSSGYWNVMDPANGFTAIHAGALSALPLAKIEQRFFFESDMLFRLNTVRAVVKEVPMQAVYGDEKSNLRIAQVVREFPPRYASRFLKRICYNYLLRDFNVCSVELLAGLASLFFGVCFGGYHWYQGIVRGQANPTGTIMFAVLPIVIGVQLLLAAVSFDVANVPTEPLQNMLPGSKKLKGTIIPPQKVAND